MIIWSHRLFRKSKDNNEKQKIIIFLTCVLFKVKLKIKTNLNINTFMSFFRDFIKLYDI